MTFSIPTINNTMERIITKETSVRPGNTSAIMARIMAMAPRPIWAARFHPEDFCEFTMRRLIISNYLNVGNSFS
jgi:lambda repressor-like predicted transcriptional regulator